MTSISFLGACREVGRSCFLVEGKQKTLLDCGLKFSEGEEYPLLQKKQMKQLDRVVLSHAHLDHSGYLPALYEHGFAGKTFCTKPTRDLVQVLLADYLRLAKEKGKAAYSQKSVTKLLANTEILDYSDEKNFEKTGIRFEEAGHILGSAMTLLRHEGGVLCYTGDVNFRETRLLEPAREGVSANSLIIESTYGAKTDKHVSSKAAANEFVSLVKKTLENGGKAIVPTFAIGRGQEVLFTLESFMRSGALPEVPIYLEGMVKKALRIYRHNAVFLKREVQLRILTSDDDPFKSSHYRFSEKRDRSDVLEGGPCIVLSTSGMLNGGPVLHYLEKLGDDKNNALIMVGYQAEGTRGRQLLEGAKELVLDGGKTIPISLQVLQAPFSAHADHDELVKFAKSVQGLEKVFCVHGEASKAGELAADIEAACNKNKSSHEKKVAAIAPELESTHEA